MENTFEKIYAVVRQIPSGQVCSYGTVAALAGNRRWARVVGYAMAACRDPDVPCHRVLHKDGTPSAAFEKNGVNCQVVLLKNEGVCFLTDGRVDMAHFAWFCGV